MRGKKEEKVRIRIYLPKELYIELHKRYLFEHFSFLIASFLEEFLKTDVRISWDELPSKKGQKEFLEQKLQELFSRETKPLPIQQQVEKVEEKKVEEKVEEQSTHEQKLNVDELKIDYDQFW